MFKAYSALSSERGSSWGDTEENHQESNKGLNKAISLLTFKSDPGQKGDEVIYFPFWEVYLDPRDLFVSSSSIAEEDTL